MVEALVFPVLEWLGGKWWTARRRRKLLNHPLVHAAEAGLRNADPVRLTGEVVPITPLYSPVSGQACAYYAVHIQARQQGTWVTCVRDTRGAPFLLRDESGDALVDPRAAHLRITPVITKPASIAAASAYLRAELEAFAARIRAKYPERSPWDLNQGVRCSEVAVVAGAVVAVTGVPVRDADPNGAARASGYRELPPTRAFVGATPRARVTITDDHVVVADGAHLVPRDCKSMSVLADHLDTVRATGRVVLRAPLTAPLSGRACAYWELEIAEGRSWPITLRLTKSTPFLLRGEQGDAMIDPAGARVGLPTALVRRMTVEDASEEFRALLAANGFESSGRMFYKSFRCAEDRPARCGDRGDRPVGRRCGPRRRGADRGRARPAADVRPALLDARASAAHHPGQGFAVIVPATMRTAIAIASIVVAGCQSSEAEKTCDALVAQLEACHLGPDPVPRSTRRYCEVTMSEQADPARGESLLTVAQRALRECSATTTCPAFSECLARHQCVMLMASPTAEPQFECSR